MTTQLSIWRTCIALILAASIMGCSQSPPPTPDVFPSVTNVPTAVIIPTPPPAGLEATPVQTVPEKIVPGMVGVKIKSGGSLGAFLARHGLKDSDARLFFVDPQNPGRPFDDNAKAIGLDRWYLITVAEGTEAAKLTEFQIDADVEAATLYSTNLTYQGPTAIIPPSTEGSRLLSAGNIWVYQVTRYQAYPIPETMTVTRVVTDTVVNIETIAPYVVATIHRSEDAETAVAVPANMLDILMPAGSHNYWLIAKGDRLYRQDNKLDLSALDGALLELAFPLTLGAQWYQSDLLAKSNPTPRADAYMLRKVTEVGAVTVPAGRFDACYFLQEEWAGTTFENWYCPAVGWVDQKADHHGTPEGWREVLIRYQLNR